MTSFLAERRRLIATAINEFLNTWVAEQKTESGESYIKRLIAAGESEKSEFKSSLRWDYKELKKNKELEKVIVKTIAGLLNGKGGYLLIGIGPERQILGIEPYYATFSKDPNRDGFEQKIVNLLVKHIGKEFVHLISTTFVEVDGKDVCLIHVRPSPKPVHIEEDGGAVKFYTRLGNTTVPMGPKEMTDYIALRWETSGGGFTSAAGA